MFIIVHTNRQIILLSRSENMSTKENNYTHPTVTTTELIEDIIHSVSVMPKHNQAPQPMMVWGQPGVGKSEVIRSVGVKLGRPVIDIRLLLKDPTDLSGIPYFNAEYKRMLYAAPNELPPSKDEMRAFQRAIGEATVEPSAEAPDQFQLINIMNKIQTEVDLSDDEKSMLMHEVVQGTAIVLLDELSSATPAVQAAALQLVLERRIGTYELADGVAIIAAGNRAEDATQHFSMPTPLRNRFGHRTLVVDAESWLEWAVDNKIHPVVVGYVKGNQSHLNQFDPKNKAAYAFCTPRSWKFVSDFLWSVSDEQGRITGLKSRYKFVARNVSSLIGEGVAASLMASVELIGTLPDVMDILDGKVKKFDLESVKLSASYSLIVNLCYVMRDLQAKAKDNDQDNFDSIMRKLGNHYLDFLMENMDFQQDFIIMGATIALDQYSLEIDGCESLSTLLDRHEDILNML